MDLPGWGFVKPCHVGESVVQEGMRQKTARKNKPLPQSPSGNEARRTRRKESASLPEKVCPNCQEHLPASYHFGPYDGVEAGVGAGRLKWWLIADRKMTTVM